MEDGPHLEVLLDAIRLEGEAQRRLLDGDADGGRRGMLAAAERYRDSWELAPPRSYGRLIGMLKAAVIAGAPEAAAAYAREAVGPAGDSPPSWYALAIVALVEGDDALAREAAAGMEAGPEPFVRAAAGIRAVAEGDEAALDAALAAIVADFEGRAEHLTGVPIADTALMLRTLAAARGLRAGARSALLPD